MVTGTLYLDALQSGVPPYGQIAADEVVALPYSYTRSGNGQRLALCPTMRSTHPFGIISPSHATWPHLPGVCTGVGGGRGQRI